MQSGVFRLPNGNTIITVANAARIFEVSGEPPSVIWDFQFDDGQMIARAQKYPNNYLFPQYISGDVNFDQVINISDVLMIADMIYGQGYDPTPPADVNHDGSFNISDVAELIQILLGL